MKPWQSGEPVEKHLTYEVRPQGSLATPIRVNQRLAQWQVADTLAEFGSWKGWEWRVVPERRGLKPGRYRSPDGVLGTVGEFDHYANRYTFYPDGHVAPAIAGPGIPDGLTRIGRGDTAGWVRIDKREHPHGCPCDACEMRRTRHG